MKNRHSPGTFRILHSRLGPSFAAALVRSAKMTKHLVPSFRSRLLLAPAAAALLLAGPSLVHAQSLVVDEAPPYGNSPYNFGNNAIYSQVIVGLSGIGEFAHFEGTLTNTGSPGTLHLGYNPNSSGSYQLSAGTLSVNNEVVGYNGSGTFTQFGGTHTVNTNLVLGLIAGSGGSYNLNGGTLNPTQVSGNAGSSTFNFNGGTLLAKGNNNTFFQGLTKANVQTGGAKIDTNGFNVTIAQALLHDSALGAAADGGVTKRGAGTLTLIVASTYTGGTTVSAGTLGLGAPGSPGSAAGLGSKGNVTIAAGATLNVFSLGASGYFLGLGRTLTNSGTILGNLAIDSGATFTGSGILNGALTVNGGGLVMLTSGTLTVNGNLTNYGTMRFARGAALAVGGGGTFVNDGVLDIITGSFSAPAGFTNSGVVLDSSVVKARSVSRSGGVVTVVIDSYTGHTYRLERRDSLTSGTFNYLGNPQNGSTGTALTFTDPNPALTQGFYRVVVDP